MPSAPAGQGETPVVVCSDLCVGYDGRDVVRNVCLEIPAGIFLPFVGANGAGKTTLLRTILGLLKPTGGMLRTDFGGRPCGYVPQQRVIDPLLPLSTRQIVAMGLHPELGFWRRLSAAHRQRLDDVLARMNLLEHGEKTFGELSGGMRQKALAARAFVSDARVFVMDEPTSELDAESRRELLHCLHEKSRQGAVVLLAHHGINGIAEFASEVCLVGDGAARRVSLDDVAAETGLKPSPASNPGGPEI